MLLTWTPTLHAVGMHCMTEMLNRSAFAHGARPTLALRVTGLDSRFAADMQVTELPL